MPKPQKKHCALFMIFAAPAVIFLYILTRKSYHLLESMYVLLAIMFVFPLYLTVIYSFTIGKTKRSLKVLIGVAASGLAIFYWTIPSFLRGQYEFARNAFFCHRGRIHTFRNMDFKIFVSSFVHFVLNDKNISIF